MKGFASGLSGAVATTGSPLVGSFADRHVQRHLAEKVAAEFFGHAPRAFAEDV